MMRLFVKYICMYHLLTRSSFVLKISLLRYIVDPVNQSAIETLFFQLWQWHFCNLKQWSLIKVNLLKQYKKLRWVWKTFLWSYILGQWNIHLVWKFVDFVLFPFLTDYEFEWFEMLIPCGYTLYSFLLEFLQFIQLWLFGWYLFQKKCILQKNKFRIYLNYCLPLFRFLKIWIKTFLTMK